MGFVTQPGSDTFSQRIWPHIFQHEGQYLSYEQRSPKSQAHIHRQADINNKAQVCDGWRSVFEIVRDADAVHYRLLAWQKSCTGQLM